MPVQALKTKNLQVHNLQVYKILRQLSKKYCLLLQRGWDSNPRYSYPYTNFPGLLLQPLGHLSIGLRMQITQKNTS